jgi:hypothetical protein
MGDKDWNDMENLSEYEEYGDWLASWGSEYLLSVFYPPDLDSYLISS